MSLAMTWGLSPLDWRSHAIDEQRNHPLSVLKAECGHLLIMVPLHEAHYGPACQACATRQRAALDGAHHLVSLSQASIRCTHRRTCSTS